MTTPMRTRLAALCFGLCALSGATVAQTVSPETFFSHSAYTQLKSSPSGKFIGALIPVRGRLAVAVIDLETMKPDVAASLEGRDISWYDWVNDNRLVLSLADLQAGLGEQRGGGLYAVNRDGSQFVELSPTMMRAFNQGNLRYHPMLFMQALGDGSDDILVQAWERSTEHPDVYRVNTKTGRKTLKSFDSPGNVTRWLADRQGVVRAGITDEKSLRSKVFYRAGENAPWEQLGDFGLRDHRMLPVGFDGDGTLFVASNVGRDTFAIYTYDSGKKAIGELVVGHDRVDIFDGLSVGGVGFEGLVFDGRKNKIVGVRYNFDREATAWLDQDWARMQAGVDAALPGHVNVLRRVGNGSRVLVHSYSDVDPGVYYLLDTDKRGLEPLLATRKGIKPEQMAPMQLVSYPARDGLEIPAYLTLPKGREAKNLPLIVRVHGGPWVRGHSWRWDPETQYLAALGYAVLSPEFRGSRGYGKRLYEAGWREWGFAMQDDLNDGVDWLAGKGVVDRKRVCILGASYGGYAVMMGLARDPELWRCGVNYVGVTDIRLFLEIAWADYSQSDWIRYAAKELVGDPDAEVARFKASSPLENAGRIRAPVLMAYGGGDYRVPIAHGNRMRDALDNRADSVEWIVYPEEGHGFLKEANRYDFYRRVAKFLNANLGEAATPPK